MSSRPAESLLPVSLIINPVFLYHSISDSVVIENVCCWYRPMTPTSVNLLGRPAGSADVLDTIALCVLIGESTMLCGRVVDGPLNPGSVVESWLLLVISQELPKQKHGLRVRCRVMTSSHVVAACLLGFRRVQSGV
jgi:hypothetical protein